MKKLILASLIALSVTAFAVYKMLPEEQTDYAARMQKQADHINSLGSTWTAGVNHRFEQSPMTNYIMESKYLDGPKMPSRGFLSEMSAELPESFDSRENWSQCESLHEVRDQSSCGSCWAFGAVEAMSDRICIESVKRGDKTPLQTRISADDLLSCCVSKLWPPSEWFGCGNGCSGGYPAKAWDYFQNTGIVTGNLYGDNSTCKPYSFPSCAHHEHIDGLKDCPSDLYDTPTCTDSCYSKTYGKAYADDKWFGGKSYGVEGVENIMREIYENGPVEASFTVFSDFENYKSGVYQYTSGSQLGGHAIKIVGWGVENGVKFWEVTNSWNEHWGMKGDFRIKRGSNECGIEGGVVASVPILPKA